MVRTSWLKMTARGSDASWAPRGEATATADGTHEASAGLSGGLEMPALDRHGKPSPGFMSISKGSARRL